VTSYLALAPTASGPAHRARVVLFLPEAEMYRRPVSHRPAVRRLVGAICGLLLLVVTASFSRADDAVVDFNIFANTAGNRWTYGSTTSLGGPFTLFPNLIIEPGPNRKGWGNMVNDEVMKNLNTFDVNIGGINVPALSVTIEPHSNNLFTVVRWTAPSSGSATIVARFLRYSTGTFQSAQVAILHGNAKVYSRWLVRDYSPVVSTAITLTVNAGDFIDFVAGTGDNSSTGDLIGLDATVNLEPVATASGAVVAFGSERFIACAGDSAAESLAFDPINRRLASNGIIRSVCGSALFNGPDLAPGLAWDQRTQTYWQITNARVIKQWSATGVFLGDLLTLPATFSVPGWGVDTLDAVKGIATDSNFVYVVDAGPMGLQGTIHANEWFKFTRAGVPVKSSKQTNFHANLDLSPDALVDDVVYVPFSSPILKGKLIIPLEHSGFQVIDTDGNFVSKFRWTDPGVPAGIKISGFAGATIDPLNGNLYFVENSGGTTQIWTRIATTGATFYMVGTGGGPPRLHLPAVGCNRPLWKDYPSDATLVFGSAYRTANESIYGVDFGSSQLYRFFPGSGDGGRVGITGLFGDWGCAYDTERDVFYGTTGSGNTTRLISFDPYGGSADPRPSMIGFGIEDIAFDSANKNVYAVSGSQLIRIDRDTGIGTVVGATANVRGLDYEKLSDRLIGIQNSGPGGSATLWSINPGTGASTMITTVPTNQAWEGLSVVPLPATGVVGVEGTPGETSAEFLTTVPNPSHHSVALQYSLPIPADVKVAVFDVQGRLVRSLDSGHREAGPHRLQWDGKNEHGNAAATGIYFARVEYGSRALISRIVRVE
jgi:FlgD Ig-like domain